jgi:pyruvoyl-dependent arginine decarboxylase (PvlArgDC)
MDGDPGERIGAGIGWGWVKNINGLRYGLVAEAHGYKDKQTLERELNWKLQEMARVRNSKLTYSETKIECLSVPKNRYGCAIVALVYVPWEPEESMRENLNLNVDVISQAALEKQIKPK